jgi:predicted phage terminase large subunit-like protein
MSLPITADQIKTLLSKLHLLTPEQQMELLELLRLHEKIENLEKQKTDFTSFVKSVWPGFIEGAHHTIIGDAFNRIAKGELKRLIIAIAPRHGKSELGSIHFPAWYMGKFPDRKIIQCSNTAELAVGFGRKVRDLVSKEVYSNTFPDVKLKTDSKAAGRWSTNVGGDYFAIGVDGAVTGKGANLLIIDDPHSEQEAKMNDSKVYEKTYSWYMSGPRQRLQPEASVVLIATRWSKGDLTGRLLDDMKNREGADQWEYIELPAIMPDGQPLWPDFWKLEELQSIKASIPAHLWQSQYMQQPTAEESAIIKRGWWRTWTAEDPPKTDFIIQSWDTAFLKTERADYSACTTWGVFSWTNDDGRKTSCIILLDAYKEKLEFPELKKKAIEFYKYWKPDSLIVEAKAAGSPLIHELRRSGIPVQDFNPGGQDKVARLNAVSDIFQSGMVFVPATRWAEEVIEEVADFPFGRHDDLVDSTSQALLRFRRGGFIKLPGEDEEDEKRPLIKADYY